LYAKAMLEGSRPASCAWRLTLAADAANCSGVSRGRRTLFVMGYHPSARRPARRSDAGLSPPVQMGGWGFCTGLGANTTLAKRQTVCALKRRIVLCPELPEGADVLVADGTALLERRGTKGFKLFAHPPNATPDNNPPLGEHVDRGQHLGGEDGRTV